jgi:hypothetical protein
MRSGIPASAGDAEFISACVCIAGRLSCTYVLHVTVRHIHLCIKLCINVHCTRIVCISVYTQAVCISVCTLVLLNRGRVSRRNLDVTKEYATAKIFTQ